MAYLYILQAKCLADLVPEVFTINFESKIVPIYIRCANSGEHHFVDDETIQHNHPIAVIGFDPIGFYKISFHKFSLKLLG